MDGVTIIIPGKPWAKQRPRFSRKSGTAFTPKETVSFENTVRALAAQEFREPIQGVVRVTIHAFFQIPKSWSKKKKAEHYGCWHTQRPDLDNIVKAVTDGMNRVAYVDDAQIAETISSKSWTDEMPRTIVMVEALT